MSTRTACYFYLVELVCRLHNLPQRSFPPKLARPVILPVDRSDDGQFFHHVTIELVEVEKLPPVWDSADVRIKMSTRFKLEGNDKFVAGDYVR